MSAYHLKPNGEPGRCAAQESRCPFATPDAHYATAAEARAAYERSRELLREQLAALETVAVNEPGEHFFETVAAPEGRKLGTIMRREGMFLAGVHDGSAPSSVGEYWSRDEALEALLANGGEGQAQNA